MGIKLIILLALLIGVLYSVHLLVKDYWALLIILLALLIGVLYSVHLLVKDYQALSASRLARLLFKRDVRVENKKPEVRWNAILRYDSAQCARYLFCELGARPADNAVGRGFTFMLTLEPDKENKEAWEVFLEAYRFGEAVHLGPVEGCRRRFSCPFHYDVLFDLVSFMVRDSTPL